MFLRKRAKLAEKKTFFVLKADKETSCSDKTTTCQSPNFYWT